MLSVDFVLFVLTFIPAFSGIGSEPGLADRILGNYRFGGWRADVAWMCASSVFIVAVGLPWIRENRSAKITRIAWYLVGLHTVLFVLHRPSHVWMSGMNARLEEKPRWFSMSQQVIHDPKMHQKWVR